jgi:hypothetical protein
VHASAPLAKVSRSSTGLARYRPFQLRDGISASWKEGQTLQDLVDVDRAISLNGLARGETTKRQALAIGYLAKIVSIRFERLSGVAMRGYPLVDPRLNGRGSPFQVQERGAQEKSGAAPLSR